MSDVFRVEVDEDDFGYFDDAVECEECGEEIPGVLDDPDVPSLCSQCAENERRSRIVAAIETSRQGVEA